MIQNQASAPKDEIEAILGDLRARVQAVYVFYAILCVTLLILVLLAILRRFGGSTLTDLMHHFPTTNPETHRVISAIRHEVLKHNSTALQGLLQGIENGEEIHEQADWCYQALIGHDMDEHGSAYDD